MEDGEDGSRILPPFLPLPPTKKDAIMIRSYLKIAWRSLIKDRQFTLLNLLGLSTGLACTLLIYLWVVDELGVDKHNAKDAQLFQIMVNQPHEDGIKTGEHTPGLLADALKAEMPEVE